MAAHQAPPFMGFSSQEYWNGLPFPSPRDLPNLGIKPRSPALQADFFTTEPPRKSDVSTAHLEKHMLMLGEEILKAFSHGQSCKVASERALSESPGSQVFPYP